MVPGPPFGAGSTRASGPPRLEIAIITVSREVNYLHQTLASLFMAEPHMHDLPPVRLLVGSPDCSYLSDLVHHRRLSVDVVPEREWSTIRDWPVQRRLGYNYWRALSTRMDAVEDLCICEDDVVFRDGFMVRLRAALDEIRSREAAKYVLAAYSPYDLGDDPRWRRGRYYCALDPTTYFGNCCTVISRALLPDAAAFIRRHTVDRLDWPVDLALGQFAARLGQSGEGGLFQTVSSLVQHVGYVSGGTSGDYTYSPTFERAWPD